MKITFFGTSHGYPEQNRKCSCALAEVGENRYFVDMGTDAIAPMTDLGIPYESVKAIFITHMHGDHTNGLLPFLDVCSWKFKDVDPAVYLPGDMETTVSAINGWLGCTGIKPRPFRYFAVEEGLLYDDGVLRVTAYRTKHANFSYAYLLEAEGKRVLFSGDLYSKVPMEDFPYGALAQPLDLAICEAAHFDPNAYLKVFKPNENIKKLCFNHYASRWMDAILSVEETLSPMPTFHAVDGMELTV